MLHAVAAVSLNMNGVGANPKTFHLRDGIFRQISKHVRAQVIFLHLVCEPTHLMRVFRRGNFGIVTSSPV